MSIQLITPETKPLHMDCYTDGEKDPLLHVSEMFYNTIQGEGVNVGHPSAFIRLQGCTLNCVWCDTKRIRDVGHMFYAKELFELMEHSHKDKDGFLKGCMMTHLFYGQHLVITGGSPLNQQRELIRFIQAFIQYYQFKPYIEVENECVIMPDEELVHYVDCWSNSPKLSNSENSPTARFNRVVIKRTAQLPNSWFKFVVSKEVDWFEIEKDFIKPGHVQKDQILLMPQGKNRLELIQNSELVVGICTRENIRYSPREHVMIWDDEIGK